MKTFEYVRGIQKDLLPEFEDMFPHHHILTIRVGFDAENPSEPASIDFHLVSRNHERGVFNVPIGSAEYIGPTRAEVIAYGVKLLYDPTYIRGILANPRQESPMMRTQ